MKIPTVNVVEYVNNSILRIHSFTEDKSGNKEAEEVYLSIIKEHEPDASNHEIEMFLEYSYYRQGNYQAFLTHSS